MEIKSVFTTIVTQIFKDLGSILEGIKIRPPKIIAIKQKVEIIARLLQEKGAIKCKKDERNEARQITIKQFIFI